MGRKKVEFTKEQDDRIAQLVNEGYSLNITQPESMETAIIDDNIQILLFIINLLNITYVLLRDSCLCLNHLCIIRPQ